jgi:hypothetical protein
MRPLLATLAVAALALAGCGDDPIEKANIGKVRAVVTQFAESGDASACDLLTGDALVNVYGGFNAPVEKARANCKRRAASFRGEPVTIQKADVIDNQTAKVLALSKDGKFTYSVTVRRPHKKWLIDEINQHKVVP